MKKLLLRSGRRYLLHLRLRLRLRRLRQLRLLTLTPGSIDFLILQRLLRCFQSIILVMIV